MLKRKVTRYVVEYGTKTFRDCANFGPQEREKAVDFYFSHKDKPFIEFQTVIVTKPHRLRKE